MPEPIVEQELAVRLAFPAAATPGHLPPTGYVPVKDSSNQLVVEWVSQSSLGGGGTVPYSNTNLAAVSGVGLIWFDPVNGWLKFRKKSEDADANVYVISLSDPIPA
jgi:hypothetical protein